MTEQEKAYYGLQQYFLALQYKLTLYEMEKLNPPEYLLKNFEDTKRKLHIFSKAHEKTNSPWVLSSDLIFHQKPAHLNKIQFKSISNLADIFITRGREEHSYHTTNFQGGPADRNRPFYSYHPIGVDVPIIKPDIYAGVLFIGWLVLLSYSLGSLFIPSFAPFGWQHTPLPNSPVFLTYSEIIL